MNWIQGIQRAIDYAEANITEDINYEEVALPIGNFVRTFSGGKT